MFRRRIIINCKQDGTTINVRAALEDDFHHFRVELTSLDGHVSSINGDSPRRPYTLCAAAAGQLDALLGSRLFSEAHEVTRIAEPTGQCTHLFELAGLAIAAAASGVMHRQYDIEVPMRVEGRTRSRILRDGVPMLEWNVLDSVIQGPPPFAGVDLYSGMARWALNTLPREEAEAAIALRRCTNIAKGREKNLDAQIHAMPNGNCFSQQPERAAQALRIVGSTWDFSETPERLCDDDRDWLAQTGASAT
jgi:hypothetical protein